MCDESPLLIEKLKREMTVMREKRLCEDESARPLRLHHLDSLYILLFLSLHRVLFLKIERK